MAIAFFLDSFNVGTGGVGTTIARTGYGFQPKCFLLWTSGCTESTDAGGGGDARMCLGFGVAPNMRVARSTVTTDAQATAICAVRGDAAQVLAQVINPTTSVGRLDIQSMDSGGITFIIDVAFTLNMRCHVLAIGGDTISAVHAGTFDTTVSTGTLAVTAPNFRPSIVFFLATMAAMGISEGAINNDAGVGFGVGLSSTKQGIVGWGSNQAATTMKTQRYAYSGECYATYTQAVNALTSRGSFVSLDDTGFTVNRLASGTNCRIAYLAIQGGSWDVGTLQTRTDGNAIVVTGLSFMPQALLFASHGAAENTQNVPVAHALFSFGAGTSAAARAAHGMSDEDALADSEVARFIEYDAVLVKSDLADGIAALMDIQSMDSTGFTCVMDTPEPTSASHVLWVAGGEEAAPTAPPLRTLTLLGAGR